MTSDEKTTGNGLVVSMFKDGSIRWVTQPGRKKDPQPIPPEVLRQHLDEGLAEKLFVKYNKFKPIPKHKGDNRKFHGRYMCIILAARMMELGAVLSEERRAYLRKLIPQVFYSCFLRSRSLNVNILRSQAITVAAIPSLTTGAFATRAKYNS